MDPEVQSGLHGVILVVRPEQQWQSQAMAITQADIKRQTRVHMKIFMRRSCVWQNVLGIFDVRGCFGNVSLLFIQQTQLVECEGNQVVIVSDATLAERNARLSSQLFDKNDVFVCVRACVHVTWTAPA